MLYSFIIYLYSLAARLISPFHKKARKMILGQRETDSILLEKIDRNAKYIWFHASSLGEFEQGRPLIERIKADHPEYKILISFFSSSGYEVRKNYDQADVVCYLPFDTPRKVRKFIKLANPYMAIFIKYEFWGNYLKELKRHNIPVYITSAIFRKDQLFFKWYGKTYRNMLTYFDHLFLQDNNSKELLHSIGITNVTVAGDTRFDSVWKVYNNRKDIPSLEIFLQNANENKQRMLIAGSTWPKDEDILINYFNEKPDLKLIIAPHEIHEEHLIYIESLLKRPSVRLSQLSEKDLTDKDCIILDCFGLLTSIYQYGEIAFIGGGFTSSGIHNTLEAAVYDVPVIFGPIYEKFKEAVDLLKIGGGFTFNNAAEFEACINNLLTYPELLSNAGKVAGSFVKDNIGATDKILKQLPL